MGLETSKKRRHKGGHISNYEAISTHKHHFSIIFQEIIPRDKSFATHRANFSSKDGFEKMEMIFTKVKEIFVNNTRSNKNLLQGLHRYHILGDMKLSWRPM